MFIKIKPLQGAECEIEIDENSPVSKLHEVVKDKLCIDTMLKKMVFVYKGKSLTTDENKIIKDYNIISGEKVNLLLKPVINNGVVKDSAGKIEKFEHLLKDYLKSYYDGDQVNLIVERFHQILEEKIKSMNYSDFEQLSRMWFPE